MELGYADIHAACNGEADVLLKIINSSSYFIVRGMKSRAGASGVNGRVRSGKRHNLSDDKSGARRVGEIFNSLRGNAEKSRGSFVARQLLLCNTA